MLIVGILSITDTEYHIDGYGSRIISLSSAASMLSIYPDGEDIQKRHTCQFFMCEPGHTAYRWMSIEDSPLPAVRYQYTGTIVPE